MTLQAPNPERHTSRHDPESFLYVFLWVTITNHTEDVPETSKFRQWSDGDWANWQYASHLIWTRIIFRLSWVNLLLKSTPSSRSPKVCVKLYFSFAGWGNLDRDKTASSPQAAEKLCQGMTRAFEEEVGSQGAKHTEQNEQICPGPFPTCNVCTWKSEVPYHVNTVCVRSIVRRHISTLRQDYRHFIASGFALNLEAYSKTLD